MGSADGISFDPETLINYELGFKSSFWDRRAVASIALYYMDWDDIQLTIDNPDTPVFDPTIINAGKAHSLGLEGELEVLVTERLRLAANFSLLEAEYDEGTLPTGEALQRIPYAARYNGMLQAEYGIPLATAGTVSLQSEVIARGSSYLTTDNQPDGRVNDYTILNFRASYLSPKEHWSLSAWVNNVTDKHVKQRLMDLSSLDFVGQKFTVFNDPRTYGITLRFNL